ncbi:type II toxin-antitoxin system RelE/ParE family toxin [Rhizobium binxianense]
MGRATIFRWGGIPERNVSQICPLASRQRVYRITPTSVQDLESIWRYTFETWSLSQADDYYNLLIGCFPDLAAGFKRGRRIEGAWERFHAFPCGSHFIIYTENDRAVTVIRILHKRMNIATYL